MIPKKSGVKISRDSTDSSIGILAVSQNSCRLLSTAIASYTNGLYGLHLLNIMSSESVDPDYCNDKSTFEHILIPLIPNKNGGKCA